MTILKSRCFNDLGFFCSDGFEMTSNQKFGQVPAGIFSWICSLVDNSENSLDRQVAFQHVFLKVFVENRIEIIRNTHIQYIIY